LKPSVKYQLSGCDYSAASYSLFDLFSVHTSLLGGAPGIGLKLRRSSQFGLRNHLRRRTFQFSRRLPSMRSKHREVRFGRMGINYDLARSRFRF